MRICDNRRFLVMITLGLMITALWGCGGGSKKTATVGASDTTATAPPDTSLKGAISKLLNTTIERARYGDVSALWDNEFEYLHDRETYDDYTKRTQVAWAQSTADTVQNIEVDSVQPFDHDSAVADVTVHFKGPSGRETSLKQPLTVYWQDGHWIKPTISVIQQQISWDSLRNEAIKEAAKEAHGGK